MAANPDPVKDFKKALKEVEKQPDDPGKQKQVTAKIVEVYGITSVNPCDAGQRWNAATQQCE